MFEKDGILQVMGKGTVTIIDPGKMSYTNQTAVSATDPVSLHNLQVHILGYGDRYHLHQRCIFPPEG